MKRGGTKIDIVPRTSHLAPNKNKIETMVTQGMLPFHAGRRDRLGEFTNSALTSHRRS